MVRSVLYDVQIDNNSDFSSPIIDETNWKQLQLQLDGGRY